MKNTSFVVRKALLHPAAGLPEPQPLLYLLGWWRDKTKASNSNFGSWKAAPHLHSGLLQPPVRFQCRTKLTDLVKGLSGLDAEHPTVPLRFSSPSEV